MLCKIKMCYQIAVRYLFNLSVWLLLIRVSNTEKPVPSAQPAETEQEKDDRQLNQVTDMSAVLQAELIQAADRERQLQMQLAKMTDDASQLESRLEQLSNLQKDFDNFRQRSAPLWEREMKQRTSRFNRLQ